jgi:hypothetical protein
MTCGSLLGLIVALMSRKSHTKYITNTILVVFALILTVSLCAQTWAQDPASQSEEVQGDGAQQDTPQSDQPPDLTPYRRDPVLEDYVQAGEAPLPRGVVVVDVVVSNMDATLKMDRNFIRDNGEPSIAIGPLNCGSIKGTGCVVITAFSYDSNGSWGTGNAPVWLSTNNGKMWSFLPRAIPPPAGVDRDLVKGCPCDQTIEFERSYLAGSFLTRAPENNLNIYSGSSFNLMNPPEWRWEEATRGIADTTNRVSGRVDQPWLIQGKKPLGSAALGPFPLYAAYQLGIQERVAVTDRGDPPQFKKFARDNQSGTSGGSGTNGAHRIATGQPVDNENPDLGYTDVYSLYERNTGLNDPVTPTAYKVQYFLNRSGDKGVTWSLEGDVTVRNGKCNVTTKRATAGCLVAEADSTQGCDRPSCAAPNSFKFGGVNALLGGVDAIAVDPNSDDVYVVYGKRTDDGNNRLFLVRLRSQDTDSIVKAQDDTDITGAANTALPAIAVTPDRTVGVFYYSLEGTTSDGYPMFTAHLKRSYNKGVAFSDLLLVEKFVSPAKDIRDYPRQRVYGDYVQLKTKYNVQLEKIAPNDNNSFYGTFTANRLKFCDAAQGCTESTDDPIFYLVPSKAQ